MASISIPTPLRRFVEGDATVEVAGDTVGVALQNLIAKYPALKQHIFQGEKLFPFINVFVGDEDIRSLQAENTPITAQSQLFLVPAIAGGL